MSPLSGSPHGLERETDPGTTKQNAGVMRWDGRGGSAEEWGLSVLHAVREGFTEAAAFPVCQGDKWISLPIREGRERAFQVEQETAQRP